MRDGEIRSALWCRLRAIHDAELGTIYRNELGLCGGRTRVDVAVINGSVSGYEVKSQRDRLNRLPRQVTLYGAVLDQAVIVAEAPHIDKIATIVPDWWGIWVAWELEGCAHIMEDRPPGRNPAPDPLSIAQLLWRDEALATLAYRGIDIGIRSANRWQIWERLATLPLDELRSEVRSRLRERCVWPGG